MVQPISSPASHSPAQQGVLQSEEQYEQRKQDERTDWAETKVPAPPESHVDRNFMLKSMTHHLESKDEVSN